MTEHSGVSWLHDHLRASLRERREKLRESVEKGVPYPEYLGTVGRIKENQRQQDQLAELFKDFYQGDDYDE